MHFGKRAALAWRILNHKPSPLTMHAEHELHAAFGEGDDCDHWIAESAAELVLVFATQGHSGGTAPIASAAAARLMELQPLTRLTGDEGEWGLVIEDAAHGGPLWQNKRCPHVFKSEREGAYDLDGYLLEYPDGYRTTKARRIAFPYAPGDKVSVKTDDDGVPLLKKFRDLFARPLAEQAPA